MALAPDTAHDLTAGAQHRISLCSTPFLKELLPLGLIPEIRKCPRVIEGMAAFEVPLTECELYAVVTAFDANPTGQVSPSTEPMFRRMGVGQVYRLPNECGIRKSKGLIYAPFGENIRCLLWSFCNKHEGRDQSRFNFHSAPGLDIPYWSPREQKNDGRLKREIKSHRGMIYSTLRFSVLRLAIAFGFACLLVSLVLVSALFVVILGVGHSDARENSSPRPRSIGSNYKRKHMNVLHASAGGRNFRFRTSI